MRQKYKVFLNERVVLLINEPPKKLLKKVDVLMVYSIDPEVVRLSFETFKSNVKLKKLYLINRDIDELWSVFQSLFEIIPAAGGLVFNEKQKCLMIFRRKSWDLPKGKLEKNETIEDCAVREVEEECGLSNVSLGKKINITYHIYTTKHGECLKPSHWFKMRVDDVPKLTPQAEEDIEKAEWVSLNKSKKLLKKAFPSINEVFKAYSKMD